MATAATYRHSGSAQRGRYARRHPSYSETEPDLEPSSSSSTSSSSNSNRHTSRRHSARDEMDHSVGRVHGHGSVRSSGHGRSRSEEEMIMRGAGLVQAQLQADSSRSERESVLRGAGIVREQIRMSQHKSPRGVTSPFGSDAESIGTTVKRHNAYSEYEESRRVLDDVEDLSHRMSRSSTHHVESGSKPGSDSSMSSKSKYSYHFDPFAELDEDDDIAPPPAPSPRGGSPTFMGRDNGIKLEVEKYSYEPDLKEEEFRESLGYGGNSHHQYRHQTHDHGHSSYYQDAPRHQEEQQFYRHQREASIHKQPNAYDRGQLVTQSSAAVIERRPPLQNMNSKPRSGNDRAHGHAMRAGLLWQTLVGEHVKFPKEWWGGARVPPMSETEEFLSSPKWSFVSRHRVRGNAVLGGFVRNRGSAGRLLLHVIVLDSKTREPIQDVAIGCFHPNARGVRRTPKPILDDENVREIWMAVRKRGPEEGASERAAMRGRGRDGLSTSLLNTALTLGHSVEDVGKPTPLGEKHSVTNDNVRAVFGDKPPIETVLILSKELYKIIVDAVEDGRNRGLASPYPARTLLQEFVFTRRG